MKILGVIFSKEFDVKYLYKIGILKGYDFKCQGEIVINFIMYSKVRKFICLDLVLVKGKNIFIRINNYK